MAYRLNEQHTMGSIFQSETPAKTPHPSHQHCDPRPPPVIMAQRVSGIVMNKHQRYHRPKQVYHLQFANKESQQGKEKKKQQQQQRCNVRTQWLFWIWLITQKSTLTLRKKRALANRRGW
ncbi:hypothetical protein CFP56_040137 [Quercus suber]|uniref:Uncharacterized protein n=1 Tax=Quercus suber TaxID=58331 RepID=A0AAW0IZS5_QUESU